MAGENLLEINDSNFDGVVLQCDVPVLVDFWAPWCVPCRQVTPIMEELADEYAGRIKVGKMNVDDSQEVAGSLGISSIPAVILFKGGKAAEKKPQIRF